MARPRAGEQRAPIPPIVGRAAVCDRLAGIVAEAKAGRCRTILIEGEAGIGKSRLVEELLGEARRSGFTVLAGRADELERMRPFAAVADALPAAGELPEAATLLALLRDTGDDGTGGLRLVDALIDFLEELSFKSAVCLALEDLHWADVATISAVRLIGRRLGYLPILVVGTYRPHPVPGELPRLVDAVCSEGGSAIVLERLDEPAVAELARVMTGAEPGDELSRLLASAGGNPLFVTELIRALQDEGAVRVYDGTADTPAGDLPPTLRLTVLRRLSFLPRETIESLRAAAVLGTSFGIEELAVMRRVSSAELIAALEPALASKVIGERGASLGFRHDLIQQAIYEDIPVPVRASMHVEAAKALTSLCMSPVRTAEHLLRGATAASPHLLDLLDDALSRVGLSAPALSIELTKLMIRLLGDDERADELALRMMLPLTVVGRFEEAEALADRLLARNQDPKIDGEIRLTRYGIMSRQGRLAQSIPELTEMLKQGRHPDDILRRARGNLATAQALTGNPVAARPLAEEVIAEAEAAKDDVTLVAGLTALATAVFTEGRVQETVEHMKRALDIDTRRRTRVPHPHVQYGSSLMLSDRLPEARSVFAAGRRREREAGEIPSLAAFAHVASLAGWLDGSWDEAFAEAQTGLELVAEGVGSYLLSMCSYFVDAQISLRRGAEAAAAKRVAEARRVIEQRGPEVFSDAIYWTDALCREGGGDLAGAMEVAWEGWSVGRFMGYASAWRWAGSDVIRLALATGYRDRAEEALEVIEEGARLAGGVASAEGAALRCRGIFLNDPDVLIASVETFERSPCVVEAAGAMEDAAVCLARRGNTTDARGLFDRALAVYERVDAVRDVARCAAAMRETGIRRGAKARRNRPATGWKSLTPKEREVALMAAGGLTNPQIADRLFVSKYTVMTHLSHVFAKLGISSRVELAAAATRDAKS